ncbi:hypothetical protein [Gemmata sp.]|uniref:hypothetical protein n=1 Tax=Gemmata sp. TaxID=1914242 RepID=UPI003F6E5E27
MSDEQILAWYDHKRDENNDPVLQNAPPASPNFRELHRRKCYLLGVTEPEDVERDWRAEQQRLAERRAAQKKKRRKR